MAKKTTDAGARKGGRKLLELARQHQDALQAAGLSATVLDKYEIALKGLESARAEPNPAAQVLIKDILREAGEVQAAIRKEFPGSAQFQAIFKANEPQPPPGEPRKVLALGRLIAKEAPDFGTNLIKHAINAATVNHLNFLCDQLEKEIGGADPEKEAAALEQQIREVGARAFEGKPEAAAFGAGK